MYRVTKPGNPSRVEKIIVTALIPINIFVLANKEFTKLKPSTLNAHLKVNLKKLISFIEKICKNKIIQQLKINKIKILFALIISPDVF